MILDAHNKKDMDLLAECIAGAPDDMQARLLAIIFYRRLMIMKNPIFRIFMWFVRKRGILPYIIFFQKMKMNDPMSINRTIHDVAEHIRHGHDMKDPLSAGGWNQDEVDTLLADVTFDRLKERYET